jgi:hypothetical protein
MVYSLRFFLSSKCSLFNNSNVFGSCIIFYIQGVLKLKKNNSGAKRLRKADIVMQKIMRGIGETLSSFIDILYTTGCMSLEYSCSFFKDIFPLMSVLEKIRPKRIWYVKWWGDWNETQATKPHCKRSDVKIWSEVHRFFKKSRGHFKTLDTRKATLSLFRTKRPTDKWRHEDSVRGKAKWSDPQSGFKCI